MTKIRRGWFGLLAAWCVVFADGVSVWADDCGYPSQCIDEGNLNAAMCLDKPEVVLFADCMQCCRDYPGGFRYNQYCEQGCYGVRQILPVFPPPIEP